MRQPTEKANTMSKARARERKKKRLAQAHAAGTAHTPKAVAEEKHTANKFDTQLNTGKNQGGKNIPNLAASSRGSARSG